MTHTFIERTIVGIDPGYARIGVGAIRKERSGIRCISYECLMPPKGSLADRLALIHSALTTFLKKLQPDIVSVEKIYFFKNAKTAIDVAQARGVILLAAQQLCIPICEYTPLQIKQAVSGYGKADKLQMQKMVQMLLSLPTVPKPDDAADALAVAICASTYTAPYAR